MANDIRRGCSMSENKFSTKAFIAILDQAWLSGLNFVIGILFIKTGTKEDYGLYNMLFGALLLTQSVQNALVNSPMTTLAPKKQDGDYRKFISAVFTFQNMLAGVLALTAGAVLFFVSVLGRHAAVDQSMSIVIIGSIPGLWLREFIRTVFFLQHEPQNAFALDLLYGLFVAAGLVLGLFNGGATSGCVLAVTGLSGILASVMLISRTGLRFESDRTEIARALRKTWGCGRWALPSVIVTWGYANSYVYIASVVLGMAAAADISAARLLLMPLGMSFVAWTNVFRPRISRLFHEGSVPTVEKIAYQSMTGLSLLVGGYSAVLLFLYPFLSRYIVGPSYSGLAPLVAGWGAYFLINGIRIVGTSCMLGKEDGYRILYYYGLFGFIASIPLSLFFTKAIGIMGVLTGLLAAEAVLAYLIWRYGWPKIKMEPASSV